MTKVYIVRGLGLGDDEDAFENMGAFTTQEKAQALIESLQKENAEDDFEVEYEIETLELE
jgi:hypothetical protein